MAISFREFPPVINILLGLLLAVVVVAIGLFTPGLPWANQRERIAAADSQLAKLKPEVAQLEDFQRRHAELQAQIAGAQKQLEVLKAIVPEEKNVDDFIRMVHTSAASSNVEIRRITAKPIVQKEFHNELPFEIEFDGPYYSVMSFFSKLGRLSRIINVSDLSFANTDRAREKGRGKYPMRPGTTVVATATATTFFTPEAQEQPPAKGAGKGPGKTPPAKR